MGLLSKALSKCLRFFLPCISFNLLSLASTTEELLGRNNRGSGLENREYDRKESAVLTTRHPAIRRSWH
jgi:hypothetical protein